MLLNTLFETNQKVNFYERFVAWNYSLWVSHNWWLIKCFWSKIFQLTLLRFLCEICLLDNKYITVSQSKMVAASLLVILKLRKRGLLKSEQVVCNQWVSYITRNCSVWCTVHPTVFQNIILDPCSGIFDILRGKSYS